MATVGDGTLTQRLVPTAVLLLTDATAVTAGERHTCARRSDAALVCWGYNEYGQLGLGEWWQTTPVVVDWP